VETFERLTVLVGVHGAGLANVIHMQPGTHLVEIFMADRSEANRHYFNMCKWLGINYHTPGYFSDTIDSALLWSEIEKIIS